MTWVYLAIIGLVVVVTPAIISTLVNWRFARVAKRNQEIDDAFIQSMEDTKERCFERIMLSQGIEPEWSATDELLYKSAIIQSQRKPDES